MGTQHDQGTHDTGATALDAGAGAWDAGPAPALSQLRAGLSHGAVVQPGEASAPVPAQPPEQFRAESFGIEAGKGGRDAGPAPRRDTPVTTSSMLSFGIARSEASMAAPARDAGTAPRQRKRRTKK